MDIRLEAPTLLTSHGGSIAPSRMALLEAIEQFGSISQAAKATGLSYRGAWNAVEELNNLSSTPLVQRTVGGKGGGGAALTEAGRTLVRVYREMEKVQRRVLGELNDADEVENYLSLIRRVLMKTSARNQLLGRVTGIKTGAVNDEIDIELPGGERIAAIITRDSTANLSLAPGKEVIVLIKAPWIILATDLAGMRISARNQLAGTVSAVHLGMVNSEVLVRLPGGNTLCAIITNDSAEALELAEGKPVTAIFKASHVILGVTA